MGGWICPGRDIKHKRGKAWFYSLGGIDETVSESDTVPNNL